MAEASRELSEPLTFRRLLHAQEQPLNVLLELAEPVQPLSVILLPLVGRARIISDNVADLVARAGGGRKHEVAPSPPDVGRDGREPWHERTMQEEWPGTNNRRACR